MELVLEAGAEDLARDGDYFEVTCDARSFDAVKAAFEVHELELESAEITYIPTNYVDLDSESAKKMQRLRDLLDENDDVQNVYSNENMPEEAVA
jgi:transcriptional/translational regulatory protein YebC/TACO1